MKYVIKKYLFIALVFLSASCSPIVENRGYVFDEKLLDQIKVNETISNDVMDILGSPSTTSAIDADRKTRAINKYFLITYFIK